MDGFPDDEHLTAKIARRWATMRVTGIPSLETVAVEQLSVLATRQMTVAIEKFRAASDKSTARIERLTRWLLGLTIALVVLTVVLAALAAPAFVEALR
jgi:hypothetical protein